MVTTDNGALMAGARVTSEELISLLTPSQVFSFPVPLATCHLGSHFLTAFPLILRRIDLPDFWRVSFNSVFIDMF